MSKTEPNNSCAILSVVAVLGAPLLLGILVGSTGAALDTMKNEVLDYEGHVLRLPDQDPLVVFTEAESVWYCVVLALGTLVGALLGGVTASFIGFRWTMLCTVPLYLASFGAQWYLSNVWLLYVSNALLGIAIGVNTFTVPTYISDVAPCQMRGFLGACNHLSVAVGILLVYIGLQFFKVSGGYTFSLDKEHFPDSMGDAPENSFCNWRWLALLNVVPTVVFAVCVFFIPESPRWLAGKRDMRSAFDVLGKLRGGHAFIKEGDLKTMETMYMTGGGKVVRDGMPPPGRSTDRPRKRGSPQTPLYVGMLLHVLQRLCGMDVVFPLCTLILKTASPDHGYYVGLAVMVGHVLMAVLCCVLIDRVGRRILLVIGSLLMGSACIGMGLFFALKTEQAATDFQADGRSFLVIGCLLLYVAGYGLGVGPIPWLAMGDLFAPEKRTWASSIATALNGATALLVGVAVALAKSLGGEQVVLWTFGLFCVGMAVFSITVVPEAYQCVMKNGYHVVSTEDDGLLEQDGLDRGRRHAIGTKSGRDVVPIDRPRTRGPMRKSRSQQFNWYKDFARNPLSPYDPPLPLLSRHGRYVANDYDTMLDENFSTEEGVSSDESPSNLNFENMMDDDNPINPEYLVSSDISESELNLYEWREPFFSKRRNKRRFLQDDSRSYMFHPAWSAIARNSMRDDRPHRRPPPTSCCLKGKRPFRNQHDFEETYRDVSDESSVPDRSPSVRPKPRPNQRPNERPNQRTNPKENPKTKPKPKTEDKEPSLDDILKMNKTDENNLWKSKDRTREVIKGNAYH